ncbi:MAG: (Fe-S)-binding protein [Candidatus Jordarchaeum sp.]|uniref:(Fe-S)-binding protein n=1 Tax=Candidatus Jordarchaeum sp. TaxID=2823881 RepID=UPI0040493434
MFNEETCERCGTCLSRCPFLQLPLEKAKEEISRMIETRTSEEILRNCAGCSYCNTICPTRSEPAGLRKEIRLKKNREEGVGSLLLITEEVPLNLMSIGFELEIEKKRENLKKYMNPPKSKEMFYIGCSLSYIYTDLVKTKLLEDLPLLGGMKYCCGGYVNSLFGQEEAKIKGKKLLKEFNKLGVEKIISFCPGCDRITRGLYPEIIEDYNIESQSIIEYLVEKYHRGELEFTNKIDKRITFHDPCPWRSLDRKIYESPRELLEIMGAEVVEMSHNREKSLCCGAPVSFRNRALAEKIANMRVSEAEEVGAEALAFICTGCVFALSKSAVEKNIEAYYITELAQKAIGEKPPHRIVEVTNQAMELMARKIVENTSLLKDKYIIKNGVVQKL